MTRIGLRCAAASAVCAAMHKAYLYRSYWWYDNLAHLLAGYAVGAVLSHIADSKREALAEFLAVAVAWECFEYKIGEYPWDGRACWDHACEDTLLDTIMGLAGVWMACRDRRLD